MDITAKKHALSAVMAKVHTLAEIAWPRDARGVSDMPHEAEMTIVEVQEAAAKALGLPDDIDLMTGDPVADLTA